MNPTIQPENWRLAILTDIAEVFFSSVDKKVAPNERPVRLCNYVDVFHNREIDDQIDFMAATATEREIERFELQRGDVIFTKDSETPEEIAEPSYVKMDLRGVLCGYHLAIARPRREVEGRFLYYAMKSSSVRRQFVRLANGVTRFGLTLDGLQTIELPVPSVAEQRRIVDVLTTWDEAIERLAYQIGQKSEAFAYIQEALVHGALRLKHRERWPVVTLGDVTGNLSARNGSRFGRDSVMGVTKADGLVPMKAHVIADEIGRYLILPPGGFAYNPMRINIGSITMSKFEEDVIVSPDYVVFACNAKRLLPRFLNHLRRTKAWSDFMTIAGNGSVRVRIYYASLADFEFHLPPLDEQQAIVGVLDDAEREIRTLRAEQAALEKQRDALATELLTGRLRVHDAMRTSVGR